MYNEIVVGEQNVGDSFTTKARGTKEGAQVATELHGKYYEACLRGRLFTSSTVIAGVVIPVAAATLNSKFTIWNPAGSGVNVELISFTTGLDTATQVVNGWGMAIQRNLTGTSGIPTSVTALVALPLGVTGVGKANCYSQATLTNVAIPGVTAATAVPIPLYPMFSSGATTAAGIFECTHNFDGRLILGPDSLGAVCTTVAAAAQNFCSLIWAEWPV
jgi:hypothetical protein